MWWLVRLVILVLVLPLAHSLQAWSESCLKPLEHYHADVRTCSLVNNLSKALAKHTTSVALTIKCTQCYWKLSSFQLLSLLSLFQKDYHLQSLSLSVSPVQRWRNFRTLFVSLLQLRPWEVLHIFAPIRPALWPRMRWPLWPLWPWKLSLLVTREPKEEILLHPQRILSKDKQIMDRQSGILCLKVLSGTVQQQSIQMMVRIVVLHPSSYWRETRLNKEYSNSSWMLWVDNTWSIRSMSLLKNWFWLKLHSPQKEKWAPLPFYSQMFPKIGKWECKQKVHQIFSSKTANTALVLMEQSRTLTHKPLYHSIFLKMKKWKV